MPNSLKGPSPSGLAQVHSDVTTFKAEYQKWLDEEEYTYPDLSVEDAEWVLEAAFNYDHQFTTTQEDSAAIIEYTSGDEVAIELNDQDMVDEVTLFETYSNLLNTGAAYSDLAPISDLSIQDDGSGFSVHAFFARLDHFWVPDPRWDYSSFHPSVYRTGGPIPSCSIAPSASEILENNLRATYDPIMQQVGYYFAVTHKEFGQDPFDQSSYDGILSSDYSLDIYGTHTSINSASIANGDPYQCLTGNQVSDFETNMINLINNETPSWQDAYNVRVEGLNPNDPFSPGSTWAHHKLSFTRAVFVAQ